MASIDAFKVRAVIEAGYDKNSLRRANQEIARSFNGMTARMSRVAAAAQASQSLFMTTGAAITAAFGAGALAAASFEEQFVRVKKTLDIKGEASDVEKAFDNIGKKLLQLTKISPVTTDAITEIAAVGGQLGVAAKDIVSFTDTVQKLTVATNLSAENAALGMSRLQEITGSTVDELDNLGSVLVDLGNNFAATESEIMTAALQIATSTSQIAGAMNNAAVDALAFSTALKAIGQPSQAGATAIVRLMTELSEAMATGGKSLELFAKVAGMSVSAFEDLYSVDSSQAVALFIKGLDDTASVGLTNVAVLQKLGLGQVRTQKAILALAKSSDTLFSALNTGNTAFRENIALNEEAQRRYETLFAEFQKGKNIIKGEFINFGQPKLEAAKDIVKDINNFLIAITKSALKFVTVFAKSALVLMPIVGAFVSIRASVRQAALDLKLFAQTAERANIAALALASKYNSKGNLRFNSENAYQYNVDENGKMTPQLARSLEPQSLFGGRMGLPFNTLRRRGVKDFIGRRYSNRIMNTVSQPQLMELIFGGNVPDILKMSTEDYMRASTGKDGKPLKIGGKTQMANLNKMVYRQDYFERFSEEGFGGFASRTFMPTKSGQAYLKSLVMVNKAQVKFFDIVDKGNNLVSIFVHNIKNELIGALKAYAKSAQILLKPLTKLFSVMRKGITGKYNAGIKEYLGLLRGGMSFGLDEMEKPTKIKSIFGGTGILSFKKDIKETTSLVEKSSRAMNKALNFATAPLRLFQTARAATQIKNKMLGIDKFTIKQLFQVSKAASDIRDQMLGTERRTVRLTKSFRKLGVFIKTEFNIGLDKMKRIFGGLISPVKLFRTEMDGVSRTLLFATKVQLGFQNALAKVKNYLMGSKGFEIAARASQKIRDLDPLRDLAGNDTAFSTDRSFSLLGTDGLLARARKRLLKQYTVSKEMSYGSKDSKGTPITVTEPVDITRPGYLRQIPEFLTKAGRARRKIREVLEPTEKVMKKSNVKDNKAQAEKLKLQIQELKVIGQSTTLGRIQNKVDAFGVKIREKREALSARLLKREQMYSELKKYSSALENKGGLTHIQVLDKEIASLLKKKGVIEKTEDLTRGAIRKYRRAAIGGRFGAFEEEINGLRALQAEGKELTTEQLQLLEATDKARLGFGRFRTAIAGVAKAIGKLAVQIAIFQGVFKLIAKFGEASRGIEEYQAALNSASEKLTEIYKQQTELQQITGEGGFLSTIQDEEVLKQSIERVDKMLAELEKNRRDAAKELGKSYLENMLIAGAGQKGSFIEYLIGYEKSFFKKSEDKAKEQIGEAIGSVLLSAVDPEEIRRRGGKLPTLGEIVNSVFFSEQEVGGVKVPTAIFDGVSSGILMGLQDAGKVTSGIDILELAGISGLKSPGKIKELGFDLQRYVSQNIGDGKFILDSIINDSASKTTGPIAEIFKNLKKELGTQYSDLDLAQFALDLAQGLAVSEGLIGTSLDNIEANFARTLSPNSPMGKQVKEFLKTRLEEFRDTGLVSAEEVARAGNNYEKIVGLYSKVYDRFTQDAKLTTEELQSRLEISESAALQLAARLDQAFTEARKSLVSLTAPLPDDAFKDMTALDIMIETLKKKAAQTKFEKVLTQLGQFGKPVLANELSKVGVGGLSMAEYYLANPATAAAQEMYLQSLGGPDYVGEIAPEQDLEDEGERMEEMGYTIGSASAEGVIKGLEEHREKIVETFSDILDEAVLTAMKNYWIKSPSGWTQKFIGKPLIDGVAIGIEDGKVVVKDTFATTIDKAVKEYKLPDTKGSYGGTTVTHEGIVNTIAANSEYAPNAIMANAVFTSFAASMDDWAKKMVSMYTQANTKLQEAWQLITAVTQAERAQTDQARNLIKAKQDYAATLRREATLTERLEKAKDKLTDLEVSGMKGNITMEERIGILQREIDLTERKRRLDKEYTAREALDIQAQEKQVAELGRMFNLGIVSGLELEAAQDVLREMKGEFKTDNEKQLFLLEYASALEQKEEYEKEILEISPELVAAREAYILLLDEQKLISLDVQAGANSIAEAEERVAAGVLAVDAAYANFKEKAPEYEKEISVLGEAFGSVNDRVDELIETITILTEDGTFDFSSLNSQISGVTQNFADYLLAKELDNLMTEGGVTSFYQKYQKGVQSMLASTGEDPKTTFAEMMRRNMLGLDAYPILQQIYSQLGGKDGQEVSDFSNIAKNIKYFENDPTATFQRLGNEFNTTGYAGAFVDLISMLGVGTQQVKETGELAFSIANAEAIAEGLSKELMVMGLKGMTDAEYMQLMNKNIELKISERSGPVVDSKYEEDRATGAGYLESSRFGTSGTSAPIIINNSTPNQTALTNWLTGFARNIYQGYGVTVPGGMMGLRAKGYKMGGRIPDMSHIKPKKYAMGGRDNLMRRALVGEYGPEEVRFVPGSGFLVKPLTQGGRGNNTIVEHLSVNVTGVPSDPSQARKAAIEIRKALNRLDKEGNVGGGIRRA